MGPTTVLDVDDDVDGELSTVDEVTEVIAGSKLLGVSPNEEMLSDGPRGALPHEQIIIETTRVAVTRPPLTNGSVGAGSTLELL